MSNLYDNGDKALQGLTQFEVALGISHVTKAMLEPVLLDARAKSLAYDNARNNKAAAYDALRAKRTAADDFLSSARSYLATFLGDSWSPAWVPLGFNRTMLVLPRRDPERKDMLLRFKQYFVEHPAQESVAANLSAASVDEVYIDLRDAVASATDGTRLVREKRNALDAANALLAKKLFCLRRELEALLDPLDPRWLEFIDRIPGDPHVPEQVTAVTANVQPGVITLDWPDAPRAARYKVVKQVIGVDAEPVLAATVADSDAQLTGVPSGATVKLQIVAANGVGDAVPSQVIELLAA